MDNIIEYFWHRASNTFTARTKEKKYVEAYNKLRDENTDEIKFVCTGTFKSIDEFKVVAVIHFENLVNRTEPSYPFPLDL